MPRKNRTRSSSPTGKRARHRSLLSSFAQSRFQSEVLPCTVMPGPVGSQRQPDVCLPCTSTVDHVGDRFQRWSDRPAAHSAISRTRTSRMAAANSSSLRYPRHPPPATRHPQIHPCRNTGTQSYDLDTKIY